MLTIADFSFLMVTRCNDENRLRLAYNSLRKLYPLSELVLVYDAVTPINLNPTDENLKEIYSEKRVYVSGGYNMALANCTKKCFVFIHDDTFLAENFLENLLPYVSETQFCNFTTIEPPLFNEPNTLLKPIHDFGRDADTFDIETFHSFCVEHTKRMEDAVIPSPLGGFFMAGYKSSIDSVGGFDEIFQPYFYEDADLIFRLYQAGFRFVQVLNSIVYHMGSLTSRGTAESDEASRTTSILFLKKWKTSWEYVRFYTLVNGIEYKKIDAEVNCTNCPQHLKPLIDLVSEPNSSIVVSVDGAQMNEKDLEYLQTLPYVLQSLTEAGQYKLGNLLITYNEG